MVYDLKTTGKVLWGKDKRKSIWLKNPKQIPYWEGIRLLYNRLIPFELLVWKKINKQPTSKTEEYNVIKSLISIGEFLIIKDGNYYSSYRDKLKYIMNKYGKFKNIIYIINALKFKLNIRLNFDILRLINVTSIFIYDILKNLNHKINSFKVPFSIKVFEFIRKFLKKDFSNLFSEIEVIQIYNQAFHLLECYIKNPQIFLVKGIKIESLNIKWKNCTEIQSSFI